MIAPVRVVWLVALLAVGAVLGGGLLVASGQATTSRPTVAAKAPEYLRACGATKAHGRSVRVDLAEGRGHYRPSCSQARGVARRWLRVRHGFDLYGRHWSCYTSRRDGVGWDHHCIWSKGAGSLDIGIGRRF